MYGFRDTRELHKSSYYVRTHKKKVVFESGRKLLPGPNLLAS